MQQHRTDDDLSHISGMLTDQAPERQRCAAEEELAIEEQLSDEHARPPSDSP
jgi:hypothetical protein